MKKDGIILNCGKLFKSYRMGTTKIEVLGGVDLELERGGFTAIVGSSGSGKSTLLHILGGLDKPDEGAVEFEGRKLNDFGGRELDKFRNKKVGFIFQFYYLLDELSILENVFLPAMVSVGFWGWISGRRELKKRAGRLLEQVGLSHRITHKPFQLSGGERQRVAIARALMNKPEIVLADEPTGNLDSATGNDILGVFQKLHKAGQTILMVTHDERIARKASRIVKLQDGKIKDQNG